MKKSLFIIFVLIVVPYYSFSQAYRLFRLKVKPYDEYIQLFSKKVFLIDNDCVIAETTLYNDDVAEFFIDGNFDVDDMFVAIRQDEKQVSRVRIKDICKMNGEIKMPKMKIILLCYKQLSKEELKNDSIIRAALFGFRDNKQWLDFTPENQKLLTDTVRWFFPTELLNDVESHRKYLVDSIYLSNYKRDFGRIPTAKEFDSLCRRTALNTAETLIGWYSWHLLRLQEKELCNECVNNTYRFTMISNFHYYNYEPCSFRIELRDDGQAVLYCSYEKRNAYEKELYCDIYPMDEQCMSEFQRLLNKIDFWNACPNDEPASLAEKNINYILESNIDGQYHVIFRGEGEDPALDELQKFLWSLTGLGENKIVHRKQRIE